MQPNQRGLKESESNLLSSSRLNQPEKILFGQGEHPVRIKNFLRHKSPLEDLNTTVNLVYDVLFAIDGESRCIHAVHARARMGGLKSELYAVSYRGN